MRSSMQRKCGNENPWICKCTDPAAEGRKACLNEQTDISYYDRNRETLYNGLKELGFECIKPEEPSICLLSLR